VSILIYYLSAYITNRFWLLSGFTRFARFIFQSNDHDNVKLLLYLVKENGKLLIIHILASFYNPVPAGTWPSAPPLVFGIITFI
jgi:hypothetical protein